MWMILVGKYFWYFEIGLSGLGIIECYSCFYDLRYGEIKFFFVLVCDYEIFWWGD